MSQVCLNVTSDGKVSPKKIVALGASGIRIVPRRQHDLRRYFGKLTDAGLSILLVLDSDSYSDFGPLEDRDGASRELFSHFRDWYDPYQVRWQPTNERTGAGPASWRMDVETYNDWLWMARRYAGDGAYIIAGALDEGPPVDGEPHPMDETDYDPVNACAVNLYGRWAGWETDPPWYFGHLLPTLARIRHRLHDVLGRTDKALELTEIGGNLTDFEGDRDRQAAYYARVVADLRATDLVNNGYLFASYRQVAEYDLWHHGGRLNAAGLAVREVLAA